MKTKVAPISVLVLMLGGLLAAQRSAPSWKEYVYPSDGFAISLPSPPSAWKDPDHPNTQYTLHPSSDVVINLSAAGDVEDCPAQLGSWKQGMRDRWGASSLKDISQGGHAGFECEHKGAQGDEVYGRFFCENGTLYTVAASWPVDTPKPSVVTRIVESFRILNPASGK
jgi:hypothetical protein